MTRTRLVQRYLNQWHCFISNMEESNELEQMEAKILLTALQTLELDGLTLLS